MEAVILVGGLGSRLGDLTKCTPKPMLPIRGIPFLARLLEYLKNHGFERVILAVGHKKEIIEEYFTKLLPDDYPTINYAIEKTVLGTGGAILNALPYVVENDVFVINGDSYLELNFKTMLDFHQTRQSDLTIASYFMEEADRFGVLCTNDDYEIVSFEEKGSNHKGLINGGIYLFNTKKLRSILLSINKISFSFEEDVLSNSELTQTLRMLHFRTKGYFLDIGIPADYQKAQSELFSK